MQEAPGKTSIGVGVLTVTTVPEGKAPVKATPEATAAQSAEGDTNKAAAEAVAKAKAREAGKLLREANVNPRVILRLLSSNNTTLRTIRGQENAELIKVNEQRLSPEQKQKLFGKIQEKYKKLLDSVGEREERVTSKIDKLKKSKKPEDQALGIDIDKGIISMHIKSLSERKTYIKSGINPDTEQPLTQVEKSTYESEVASLELEIRELEEKNTGLEGERAKIKNKKGETIPDLLEATVITMAGGDATVIEKAKDDPIGYLEKTLAGAITDKDKMDNLVKNMKTSELIGNEKDEAKFREALDLSHLDPSEFATMIATNSGKKLLLLLEVLGFLGYISWQKENNKNPQAG